MYLEACKTTRSSYEEVEIIDVGYLGVTSLDYKKGVYGHLGTRRGPGIAQFVVKVQISLNGKDDMLVYNRKRDVQYRMSMSSPLGRKLKEEILRNDLLNIRKGYFYSILREGRNYINPQILPPEIW